MPSGMPLYLQVSRLPKRCVLGMHFIISARKGMRAVGTACLVCLVGPASGGNPSRPSQPRLAQNLLLQLPSGPGEVRGFETTPKS